MDFEERIREDVYHRRLEDRRRRERREMQWLILGLLIGSAAIALLLYQRI